MCMHISGGIAGATGVVTIVAPNPVTAIITGIAGLVTAACYGMNTVNAIDEKHDEFDQCGAAGRILGSLGKLAKGTSQTVGEAIGTAVKVGCGLGKVAKEQLN